MEFLAIILIGLIKLMEKDLGPVKIPINGILDLHTFRPREIKKIISDYLIECRKRKIFTVKIIHGKGIGELKRCVYATLKNIKLVASFYSAAQTDGGWGATIVELKKNAKN